MGCTCAGRPDKMSLEHPFPAAPRITLADGIASLPPPQPPQPPQAQPNQAQGDLLGGRDGRATAATALGPVASPAETLKLLTSCAKCVG